jgi:hypothetical protein
MALNSKLFVAMNLDALKANIAHSGNLSHSVLHLRQPYRDIASLFRAISGMRRLRENASGEKILPHNPRTLVSPLTVESPSS